MSRPTRVAVAAASLLLASLALRAVAHAQAPAPTPQPEGTPVSPAQAESVPTETYAYHLQSTLTEQFSPGFAAKYSGPQSLPSAAEGRETFDATAYLGARPWPGAEIWFNAEVDQGFGLGDTAGVAGYLSGEAYKSGANDPYVQIPRLFLRQTIGMGGEDVKLDPDLNQLGGTQTSDRVVITVGKFSVVDIFDTNKYAHDPRNDFLNWSVIDAGTFDYVANAWGATYGGAAEIYRNGYAARVGAFNAPEPGAGKNIDPRILGQFELVGELEESHTLFGQPGKARLLYYFARGEQGTYNDALARAAATGTTPATSAVRRYRGKDGVTVNIEQQLAEDLGVFLRAGATQGGTENAYTDINKTIQTGIALTGTRWNRPDDTVGAAFVVNTISHAGKRYLAAGGLGGVIGDGALLHAGPEQIFETYYAAQIIKGITLTGDYQLVNHPAYNRDRGPVHALALRLHTVF